ncbi:hypothetical protein AK812_SmicGene42185 [Symbiodinium microadriaticum]|uniref:Uncharacterized protein n=1 Tax=Symbiodinium microadriaticum TaxID=2951 RepID=A0A1Q9C4A1_SYMMI|nr:hypothetical protein AK812_SmicGene42185 [Symbiodinium microadriaticum]
MDFEVAPLSPALSFALFSLAGVLSFVGLAVESGRDRLDRCVEVMSAVLLTLDPTVAAEQMMPHLTLIFGHSPKPWALDVLVVDVDGVDCLIVEELLQIVRPKILQVEVVAHIPPPFRFSLHWHASHSPDWDRFYHADRFTPTAGCSLSYALHKFRPFGYDLLRLTEHDAVFVHQSIAKVIEPGYHVKLPQDEFQCYRNSTLWFQRPASYVREWFFAKHPSAVIGRIWSNISFLNVEMGREPLPFTLDF